jgi:hypothetical protein
MYPFQLRFANKQQVSLPLRACNEELLSLFFANAGSRVVHSILRGGVYVTLFVAAPPAGKCTQKTSLVRK